MKNTLIALLVVIVAWLAYLQLRPDDGGTVSPTPAVYIAQPTQAQVMVPVIYVTATVPASVPVVVVIPQPVQPTPAPFQRDGLIGQPEATGIVGEHDPGTGHHRSTAAP